MNNRNKKTAFSILAIVFVMITLSYASVPLYDLYCRVTGYGGTVQVAEELPVYKVNNLTDVNVRFNSDVSNTLKWEFQPVKRVITAELGSSETVFYKVKNVSDKAIVGTSTFNVTPQKAGIYFNKLDCFCYEEQYLEPGEVKELPVSFFISPEIAVDENTKEVETITLSYMFFDAGKEALVKYSNNTFISNDKKIKTKLEK